VEKIDVLDANSTLLDTRTVSGFNAGQYLVWNLSGHVIIRVTNLAGSAVVSGMFFGVGGIPTPPPPPPPSGGVATFVKADSTTQGSWRSVYGSEGYNVINDAANTPGYVTVTPSGFNNHVWAASTNDLRALQKAASSDRLASCWYTGGTFTVDFSFTDQNTHQLALYLVDWDTTDRVQKIEILDTNNTVLDTRTVSGFHNGQYLVWNVSGHVIVRITNVAVNAVVSGIFFK
jgi:hypothetical protein